MGAYMSYNKYNQGWLKLCPKAVCAVDPQDYFRSIGKELIDKQLELDTEKENNAEIRHYLKQGDKLCLKGDECDGFSMQESVYEYVEHIGKVNGIDIDSFVVKRIYDGSKESPKIFSLTKDDCKMLNIQFQQGLELCPQNLPWQRIEDFEKSIMGTSSENKKESITEQKNNHFDGINLGTYPVDRETKRVRKIMIKIGRFDICFMERFARIDNDDYSIYIPNNSVEIGKIFAVRLKGSTKEYNIPYKPFVVCSNSFCRSFSVFMELDLSFVANGRGLELSLLDSFSVNDIFEVFVWGRKINKIAAKQSTYDIVQNKLKGRYILLNNKSELSPTWRYTKSNFSL